MNREPLISLTDKGLYCANAGIYIDPWRPVEKALITHAHSDHARWGHSNYLAHPVTSALMKQRLGAGINTQSLGYGETLQLNGVKVSFHPAGHIPGSAQIRLEHKAEVWVVSGDYKLEYDGLSEGFSPLSCHHFISECTFGLPVFQWKPQEQIYAEMKEWISQNTAQGLNSLLFGYALGKIQRVLNGIRSLERPIYAHGAVLQMK